MKQAAITEAERHVISYLRSLPAVRDRCEQIFELARKDALPHFSYHEERLGKLLSFVIQVIRKNHPDLSIPNHSCWRNFAAGGVDRAQRMASSWSDCDKTEKVRRKLDLAVVAVLLDAGAGSAYRYREKATGQTLSRSEALAVASWNMFMTGMFSSQNPSRHQVDANGLQNMSGKQLRDGFQVTPENPLAGASGRWEMLHRLGLALRENPEFFGEGTPRPGNMLDCLLRKRDEKNQISIHDVWNIVITGFAKVWPQTRTSLYGVNLGDVWEHSLLPKDDTGSHLVPFHKLSQWLTYSLLEPLQEAGLVIGQLESLTGLAEYRNGGLFIDSGLIRPRDPAVFSATHNVDSEVIVEWRALTIALLDITAERVRRILNLSAERMPLMKILEGGTWRAGRAIANKLRPDGGPPLRILSDGTVF